MPQILATLGIILMGIVLLANIGIKYLAAIQVIPSWGISFIFIILGLWILKYMNEKAKGGSILFSGFVGAALLLNGIGLLAAKYAF